MVVPDLSADEGSLAALPNTVDFVKYQYRHCKPILAIGESGCACLSGMGISAELGEGQADPGLGVNSSVTLSEASVTAFFERAQPPSPP